MRKLRHGHDLEGGLGVSWGNGSHQAAQTTCAKAQRSYKLSGRFRAPQRKLMWTKSRMQETEGCLGLNKTHGKSVKWYIS